MQDALANRFDGVVVEDLDRLSRDQEDISGIYKRMQFADVRIVTLSDGEVSDLHIGLKGTMNARQLKDLADKTRRGLRGRVEAGRSAGGLTYGYEVVRKLDAAGEPVRGEREMNREQAAIVIRIFEDYAAGHSPKKIAFRLNEDGVPGPSGRGWSQSTINGNRQRGAGVLNNVLYIGRLVWNRLRYVKAPDTGKRVSRLNAEADWIIKYAPEMRIITDDLWSKAKARQKAFDAKSPILREKRRPKHLFSFLLKCGECGGGDSKVSQADYGCSTTRNKGTCHNRQSIRQDKLERMVLDLFQGKLMDPELCAVFCEEYARHMNELRMAHNARLNGYRAELEKLGRRKKKIIDAIVKGVPAAQVEDELNQVCLRCEQLDDILARSEEAPLLHPRMAEHYRKEIRTVIEALNREDHRAEAADPLRGLIDTIVLTPTEKRDDLCVDLQGDLAGILRLAIGNDRESEKTLCKPMGCQDAGKVGCGGRI